MAEHILNMADRLDADTIVMSTHGRTGLRRWVYGNTTEKVIYDSTASLLIVRPPSNVLVADDLRDLV